MLSDELIEIWKTQYDENKASLLKACEQRKDVDAQTLLLQTLSKKQKAMEEAFKDLAMTRKEDGNLVPIVMANITAQSVADMVTNTILVGAAANVPLPLLSAKVQSLLYFEVISPFLMSYWEKLQKDLIDEAIMDDGGPA